MSKVTTIETQEAEQAPTTVADIPGDLGPEGIRSFTVSDSTEMAQQHHLAAVRRYLVEHQLDASSGNIAAALAIVARTFLQTIFA
ncbi:MAG: hypothetical protein U7M05_02000 [Candidatus Igneacidithiobacillus chanchocoensis]